MIEDDVKRKRPPEPDDPLCRELLCEEEWEDPLNREVISEHHDEGLPEERPEIDADLEFFEQYWRRKGAINVSGEYHKEGAPYVEEPSAWEGHALRPGGQERSAPPKIPEASPKKVEAGPRPEKAPAPKASAPKAEGVPEEKKRLERPIDLETAEVIAYALFRVAFGRGVNIPIKREGLADMDITVKGKDVIINTNQLYFNVPELSIWHVVYTHKGRPVVEFGRGVKNGFRIHRVQALLLVLEMWKGNMKQKKAKRALAEKTGISDTKGAEDDG